MIGREIIAECISCFHNNLNNNITLMIRAISNNDANVYLNFQAIICFLGILLKISTNQNNLKACSPQCKTVMQQLFVILPHIWRKQLIFNDLLNINWDVAFASNNKTNKYKYLQKIH